MELFSSLLCSVWYIMERNKNHFFLFFVRSFWIRYEDDALTRSERIICKHAPLSSIWNKNFLLLYFRNNSTYLENRERKNKKKRYKTNSSSLCLLSSLVYEARILEKRALLLFFVKLVPKNVMNSFFFGYEEERKWSDWK